MDNWGSFFGCSPPLITLQARIRDRLIALQTLLENRGSFLESQAIGSTFLTQSTPVPSVLLSEHSRNKERGHMLAVSPAVSICRSSARCSVDLEDNQPLPVNWSSEWEELCCKSAPMIALKSYDHRIHDDHIDSELAPQISGPSLMVLMTLALF